MFYHLENKNNNHNKFYMNKVYREIVDIPKATEIMSE